MHFQSLQSVQDYCKYSTLDMNDRQLYWHEHLKKTQNNQCGYFCFINTSKYFIIFYHYIKVWGKYIIDSQT